MLRAIASALQPAFIRRRRQDRKLREALKSGRSRIVIGSSGVFESGWIPTDARQFNLLRPESWSAYVAPGSVEKLLAEHVWEHLTLEEARIAAATCYRFLMPGGSIRVAVPDGLFPDAEFQEYIKVGGAAGGGYEPGHRVVYTYGMLCDVFASAGFATTLLEYHDEAGSLHAVDWDPADGMIHRSRRYDSRGAISIILDAVKPAK